MPYHGENLPEAIWNGLKAIASREASELRQPSIEECIGHVHAVVRELTGRAETLRPPIIEFYANELHARIAELVSATNT